MATPVKGPSGQSTAAGPAWLVPAEWAAELVAQTHAANEARPEYRGPRATSERFRRRSWHPEAPEGAYKNPVWTNRAVTLWQIARLIETPEGKAALYWVQPAGDAVSVKAETFMQGITEFSKHADELTGRGITVSREPIAKAIGKSKQTVTRLWRALVNLGYGDTIMNGRYLTAEERLEARAAHGNQQLRMAALRAIITPRKHRFVYLSSEGGLEGHSGVSEMDKHQRARTQEGAAASRPPSPDSRLRFSRGKSRPSRTIWDREMFEFARQVRDGAAWLAGVHPSSLAAVLNRAGVTPARWTARDLLKHLSVELKHHASAAKARGEGATAWRFMDAHETRNALAYTRWLLAEFVDPEQPTPTEDAAQQAAEGWRGRAVNQAPATPVAVPQEFAGAQAAAARAIARQAKLDAQFAARAEAAAARARAEADAEQSALILAELRAKYPRRPRHV